MANGPPRWAVAGMIVFVTVIPPATAHSGRTDASGCHTCRTNCAKYGLRSGQYHCHGGARSSPSPPTRTQKPPPPPSVQLPRRSELADRDLPERSISIRSSQPSNRGSGVRVKVLAVVDGDTFVAREGDKLYMLQLRSLEAPELRQAYGVQARERLAEWIAERWVMIWPTKGTGCLISVQVETTDGADISERMLSKGLLWARESAPEELRRHETAARLRKVGLWMDLSPESPWEYRARRTMAGQR